MTKSLLCRLTTALTALAFAAMGAANLLHTPAMTAGLAHLGYPAYLATILGAWKLLGAAAIVMPGPVRLKELAFAGMLFDLTGAAMSHAAVGDPVGHVVAPLILLGMVAAAWALRPATLLATAAEWSEGPAAT
jgi:hypothetical protein